MDQHIVRYRHALNYLINKNNIRQAELAQNANISQAQLNRILKHPEQVGSEAARRRIASALNTTYEKMLELGSKLIENNDFIEDKHLDLVPINNIRTASSEAVNIIEKILYIDKNDNTKLKYINTLVNEFYVLR